MRTGTVSYKVDDLRKSIIIPIGFVGENDFTRVIFDAEEIYKNYPAAQVSMKVQPPKGGIYPATVTRDGNAVIWQVKAADVAHRGSGELQLTFTADTMVEKSYIAKTDIKRSLVGNGPAPDPVQDWLDEAQEALEGIESAEVHQPIIGNDGYWYRWDAEAGEYVTTGTKAQGQDGHSPVLTSSKSGKTTTLYADGEQIAQIQDGEDGQGADVIDDTAGEGDTDKTWSADKLDEELTDVKTAIDGVSDFVGDTDTDIGHHEKTVETDIIDITVADETQSGVRFVQTKNTVTAIGTSINGFFRTFQSGIQLLAGKTYVFSIDSPVVATGFQIHCYNGNDILFSFTKSNGEYTYTLTPETNITADWKIFMSGSREVDLTKTFSIITTGSETIPNTVVEAVHDLLSDKTYFVDASGNEMLVLCKMPGKSNKDVGVKLKAFSSNNAYQFCSFGTIENDTPYVSDDPTGYTEFCSTAEDWFSPCKVYAVNNADGDYPDAKNWSGGFHKIDSKNTSRLISLDITFDGKKESGFVGYCNTIDVTVVHQLVASNTFKADGTGREVVKETIKMHFENGRIDVETTFEALEAINMTVWYFLQGHHKANGFGTGGIRYIGSDANRGITSMDENSNAGDLYGRMMRFLSDTMQMDMEIKDFDAGRFNHNTQGYSGFVSFYTTYSKAYFNAINDTTTGVSLDEGDTITARGSYRFGIFE